MRNDKCREPPSSEELLKNKDTACTICVLTFNRKGNYVRHMRQFHPEIEIQTKAVKEKKVKVVKSNIKCSECVKTFKIEKTFMQHMTRFHPDAEIPTEIAEQLIKNINHISPSNSSHEDLKEENTFEQSETESVSNDNDE